MGARAWAARRGTNGLDASLLAAAALDHASAGLMSNVSKHPWENREANTTPQGVAQSLGLLSPGEPGNIDDGSNTIPVRDR
jgi:hypothetical protein